MIMMITDKIVKAIKKINSNAQFSMSGEDINLSLIHI